MGIYGFAYLCLQVFYNTNVEVTKIESAITNITHEGVYYLRFGCKETDKPEMLCIPRSKLDVNTLLKLPLNRKKTV